MERIALLAKRIAIVAGLAVIMLLVMDFNNRMADLSRLSAQYDRENRVIVNMRATESSLVTQIAYAGSDDAVEDAVREDGRWVREGEFPVIPLTPVGSEPTPQQPDEGELEQLSYLEIWMALFFGP